jgi:Glycosyl transferases group 1
MYEKDVEKIEEERFLSYILADAKISPMRRVRQIPYLPRSQLVSLIRGARGVLFPSLHEGFGLPVLEAMMLGAPVITSNVSSLPEIAGDAALLVDPYDVDDIAQAIRALDNDEDLRAELGQRGLKRAAYFSLQAYDDRIAALYGRLGVEPNRDREDQTSAIDLSHLQHRSRYRAPSGIEKVDMAYARHFCLQDAKICAGVQYGLTRPRLMNPKQAKTLVGAVASKWATDVSVTQDTAFQRVRRWLIDPTYAAKGLGHRESPARDIVARNISGWRRNVLPAFHRSDRHLPEGAIYLNVAQHALEKSLYFS